jgi:pyrophosphatase PpaX
MGRTRAALFDLDGTLVATKHLYLEAYRRALAPHLGRALGDDELLALRPRSELRLLQDQAGAAFETCLEAFHGHYAALHDSHFEGVYDGVPALLAALRSQGLAVGVVTGKSRRSWAVTRRALPFEFDVLILDDDVSRCKPDPEGILAALERLQVEPAAAWYIGDTVSDLEAASAAGVTPGAAAWSGSPRTARFAAEAAARGAHVFPSPADVLTALTA